MATRPGLTPKGEHSRSASRARDCVPAFICTFALGILPFLIVGCEGSANKSPDSLMRPPVDIEGGRFHDHYELVGSIVPEQSNEQPIIRVSGVIFDDNRILLADVSESNVKVFSRRTGERSAVLGGAGQGPGEFEAPRYLLLGKGNSVLVGDAANSRLSRWDVLSGELLGTMPTDLGYLGGLLMVGDTLVALSAEMSGRGDVLAVLGPDYLNSSTLLPISGVLPRSVSPDHPWPNLRVFHGAAVGDTVFVTSSVSDSLWSVDLRSGAIERQQLVIPGYVHPTEPTERLRSPAELSSWASSFHTAAPMKASGGFIHIPFVQGILNYGDPQILVVRNPQGSWFGLTDAPPLVAAYNDEVLAIGNPLEDPLRFDIYRWHGPR